jgi:hypothetical protein
LSTLCNARFFDVKVLQHFIKPLPVKASSLTPSVKPFKQNLRGMPEEVSETFVIPNNSVVIVVPTEFRIELTHQDSQRQVPVLPAPFLTALQGGDLLPGCTEFDQGFAISVFSPPVLESKKIKTLVLIPLKAAKMDDLRLFFSQRKAKSSQTLTQNLEKTFCIILVLKRTDKVISITNKLHLTSCVLSYSIFKPVIKSIMQVYIRKNG